MNELWKDVQGYEGLYQVSNLGRVRKLNYRNKPGNIKALVPKTNNSGRLWFDLWKDGKNKPMLAHRLVAMMFIPNPDNLPEINHIDENPKNNDVRNLEWCTGEENRRKYYENHPNQTKRPVRNYSDKYKNRQAMPVAQLTKDGSTVRFWKNTTEIRHEMGWNDSSIIRCCEGERKSAYGYIWRFANDNISGRETA